MGNNIGSIMVIGDSISRGVIYSEEKMRYTPFKDNFIKGVSQLLTVPVHNLSKFGSTILYGKDILAQKLTELNPDVVLIEFGGNDCDFKWDEVSEKPQGDHQPQTTLFKFEHTLKSIISSLRDQGKTPVLMNLPPLNEKAYFDWFTQNSAEKGERILKWLKNSNRIYWWQEQYSFAIEQMCSQTCTRLINIRSAFLKKSNYRDYICRDGIHPNEKGHLLIKEVLQKYISNHAAYLFSAT